MERWKEYIEQLYDKAGKPEEEGIAVEREAIVPEDCKGHPLLTCEIIEAIKNMKKNKAVGVDDIPAEFLKALVKKEPKNWLRCARKCTMRDLARRLYKSGNDTIAK